MDHEKITAALGGVENYGKGITPNPFVPQQKEWERRKKHAKTRQMITDKIVSMFEPRFITPPETSECIEAIITMTDSRKILELGTHIGFTTLHMLRAVIGKEGAKVVSVDCRPAHDKAFFGKPEFKDVFEHVPDWTPQCLEPMKKRGDCFDLVFVDSDHSVEHTNAELAALLSITKPGTIFLFHDCPERQGPFDHPSQKGVIWTLLHQKINESIWRGTVLPTCEQLDCLDAWGPGYPKECNPSLGVFVRR